VSSLRLLALIVALGVAALACEVSTSVEIGVNRDGSGIVTVEVALDAEAAQRIGDVEQLRFEDLLASGWGPLDIDPRDDGSIRFSGSKPFGSPDGLQSVLDEIGGVDGVFRQWTISIDEGFDSIEWTVGGDVTLTGSIAEFSDADLAAALDGLPLARTPEELAAEIGDATFPLHVSIRLPRPVGDTNGDVDPQAPNVAGWSFDLVGEPVDASLEVDANESDRRPVRLMLIGGLMIIGALVVLVVLRLARRRPPPTSATPAPSSD